MPICERSGVHSVRLLPHYDALKAHLDSLEARHPPAFAKPPHLGPMREGIRALMEACETKYGKGTDWRERVREGYDRLCQTMWRVAREFDVRGYGLVLREKLTSKWCDCGCSTDHLGEVCEKTVRMEEEERGVRSGKEREWDGRGESRNHTYLQWILLTSLPGSGVVGWETEEEEDLWDVDIDFPDAAGDKSATPDDYDMTVGELIEWRYFRAEREKEQVHIIAVHHTSILPCSCVMQGNIAFKKGEFAEAIKRYKSAYEIEPEMPHYQLNLAAAYLKIKKCVNEACVDAFLVAERTTSFVEAEKSCDIALGQHKSVKGHWRRAQARKAQGRTEDALRGMCGYHDVNRDVTHRSTQLYTIRLASCATPAALQCGSHSRNSRIVSTGRGVTHTCLATRRIVVLMLGLIFILVRASIVVGIFIHVLVLAVGRERKQLDPSPTHTQAPAVSTRRYRRSQAQDRPDPDHGRDPRRPCLLHGDRDGGREQQDAEPRAGAGAGQKWEQDAEGRDGGSDCEPDVLVPVLGAVYGQSGVVGVQDVRVKIPSSAVVALLSASGRFSLCHPPGSGVSRSFASIAYLLVFSSCISVYRTN